MTQTQSSNASRWRRLFGVAVTVFLVAVGLSVVPPATGQVVEDLPPEMQGVGIDDNSGDQIPLGLRFRDEDGKAITLADVFNGDRPVLLSLNYSDCPMLCGVQLNGLIATLREMKLSAGKDYDLVSVSVDPLETTTRAKQTEQRYAGEYNRPGASAGFRFLTGNQKNIKALAGAVGFRYKYVPATGEYSHSAATMVVSPDGVLSRYLYGVMYDPQTVRLSLVEAANGKIGTPLDQIILYCFHYDETKGRYGPVARRLMSIGAAITVAALALGLLPVWLRRESVAETDGDEPDAAAADNGPPGDSQSGDDASGSPALAEAETREPAGVG